MLIATHPPSAVTPAGVHGGTRPCSSTSASPTPPCSGVVAQVIGRDVHWRQGSPDDAMRAVACFHKLTVDLLNGPFSHALMTALELAPPGRASRTSSPARDPTLWAS